MSEVPVHFDDRRSRHPRARHDQMIAFDALFNATGELGDVAQFLPRNSHAPAINAAT
jgi:hypothetical protein